MTTIRITQQTVSTLTAKDGKDSIYWDSELTGFGVKVSKNGRRSYIVQSRIQHGMNMRRVNLNACELMTAKEAREQARKQLASMGLGIDPITERRAVELASMTLRTALDDRIQVKGLKERVGKDYRKIANNAFPDWLDRPISTITDQMAVDRHRQVTLKRGPHVANFAMRVLSSSFNHARGQHGLKAINPVTRLREGKLFNKVKPRDEYVEPHELLVMMATLRKMELARLQQDATGVRERTGLRGKAGYFVPDGGKRPYAGMADIVRVLLLTGFRLEEAQGLEWVSVNFEQRILLLTDNKASRTLRMPMCPALVVLLERRASLLRRGDGSLPRFVFQTQGEGRYRNLSALDMPALSRAVSVATGKPFHVHAHKLRHSFATYLRDMGHSEWTVAALLNHSRGSGSVTTGYAAPMTRTMHGILAEYQGYLEGLLGADASTLLTGI